jgi:acetylornithine deacetylase/succinyl-diaminopimelate desuccinylase-like protein
MTAPGTELDEVVRICSDLIRIDSTNTGDPATSRERAAAEYVAEQLSEVGLEPTVLESAPGRTSVITRFAAGSSAGQRNAATPGAQRGALLVHTHLDVVPADAAEWSVHPLSGEVRDGYVWGRGAVDMKDTDAMVLATVRAMRREGRAPARDLVIAFLADEEAGGAYGAQWLVNNHPELFEGCTEAIGEVGGFSYTVAENLRLYLIQTAEKGLTWLRLHAKGRPGHGSFVHDDNAVTTLAEAVARVGRHKFPLTLTEPARAFLVELGDALGFEIDLDAPETALAKLGAIAPMIGSTLRTTANPTRLAAGYKDNVIPGRASATIDCRTLPGEHERLLDQLREVIGPDLDIEIVERLPPVQTSFDGALVAAMSAALRAEDSGARPVPYMLSGGTDAKSFTQLGIRCFGFTPLRLPPELNFSSLFHGIDERAPIDGLQFGQRVLDRLFATA